MPEHLVVVVQARMQSQRFPGKILAPLLGQPMLLWQLERLSRLDIPHTLVVATPDEGAPSRDLQARLATHGYECMIYPGDANDVLGRFAYVAAETEATKLVRLCGDCPLLDPGVVAQLVIYHDWQTRQADHTGMDACWPDGQDCEVFMRNALERAQADATDATDREHLAYFWTHQAQFRCATMPCPYDLRWMCHSVDTPEDLRLIESLLTIVLERAGARFTWQDIWYAVMQSPWIEQQMRQRQRNAGYLAHIGSTQPWEEVRYGRP